MERAVTDLMGRQQGLVTSGQARELGLSLEAIRRLVDTGRWERVHRGVYRVAGAPGGCQQRLMAACLAAGDGAVASHRAAAHLWGVGGLEPYLEVSVRRPRSSHAGVIAHRSGDLAEDQTTVRWGIPVTKPARTLVDLGAVVPAWRVERAVDEALAKKLVTVTGIEQARRRVAASGRNGCGVIRTILEDVGPRTDSGRLERLLWRLYLDYSLPLPEFEHSVYDAAGRLVGRVDAAHVEERLAIEGDGYVAHGAPSAFQYDRARQNALVNAGWHVLRFTYADLTRGRADAARTIRAALSRLGREGAA